MVAPFLPGSWWHQGIVAVFNGHYAVDVFFVLSGFVLTNMVRDFSGPHYLAYLGRRLLRLYPPMWASLLVAYVAIVAAHGLPCHEGCGFVEKPSGFYDTIKSILPVDYRMNPVLWSIRYEIEASLLYPFVLLLWRRSSHAWRITIIAAAVLLTCVSSDGFVDPPHYMLLFVGMPHFLLLFIVGIAISDYRLSRHEGAALAVGIGLLFISGFFFRGHTGVDDLIATISAAALISVVAYRCPSWLGAVLDNRAILKLGEISYSYYLLNAIALWIIVREMVFVSPLADFVVHALSAAVLTAAAAYGMNKAIEKPSIRYSRQLETRILAAFSSFRSSRWPARFPVLDPPDFLI